MPHRTALIVGVSAYQRLASLSNSVRDAQTIAEVLREVAGFDQVELLVNPDQRRLAEQIEHHFKNKEPDDLVLLYFSGHGITDDHGRLYFAVPDTYLDSDGQLVRASAVSCQHVHEAMGACRSRRQVIILDCCHSGAFAEGLLAKNTGKIDLRRQLGGEGRAVLTSSSSHQFSFEESKAGLSLYTEFLVEGIVTGRADLNHDGKISIDELHEFAKSKLLQARPSMTPQILPSREGYSIVISHARQVDPKCAYAAKVLEVGDLSGRLSPLARQVLLTQRQQLQITDAEALAIEESVLAPARAREQGRETLRRAVFDARRKGALAAERSMLNQLRIAFDLTEIELQALEKEPLAQQRRKIYGPPRWPRRLATAAPLAVALVGCSLYPYWRWNSARGVAPADVASPHVATPAPTPSPTPSPRPPSPTGRDVTEAELDEVLRVDRSSTTHAIRISADNTFAEARDAARIVLSKSRFMPWIVRQDFDKTLYMVYVGGYSTRAAAEADEPAARAVLEEGAISLDIRTRCPSLTWTGSGYHDCKRVVGVR